MSSIYASEEPKVELPEELAERIAKLLYRTPFRFANEAQLQEAIGVVLLGSEIPYEREVRLSAMDRIDFLCGSVGIEVKIASSPGTVQRQLLRYAKQDRVSDLLLVTTLASHRAIERELNGKRVTVVHLIASIF